MRNVFTPLVGLSTLLVVCLSYMGRTEAQTAQYYHVRRLVDGDTYELYETDNRGEYIQIRLACADTGETRRSNSVPDYTNNSQLYWGGVATNRVGQLLSQSSGVIWFNPNGGKSYNRTVGDVYLPNGTSIQTTLAREGLAMLDRRFGNCTAELEQAQSYAQWYRLGVWNDRNFIAPWNFPR